MNTLKAAPEGGELDPKGLKLLLQPLVENAIYHGIKNTRARGSVRVCVQPAEGGGVLFTVADTGMGIAPGRMAEIKTALSGGAPAGKGYGLFNVNKRLQLYYNLPEGIHIQSNYMKGTEISFVLPV
jgi:two-component system sensor histidine kinase YesM